VHDYISESWEIDVFCIQVFNNYNDNGIDVTYYYSFGKWELYCILSTRTQRDVIVS